MANLQGGSYDKQIKNAFHRLEEFRTSARTSEHSHQTHSIALAEKREMYLKDYKEFAENQGFTEKLNQTMTNENMEKFLNERLDSLAASTAENYARGFSSMVKGLEEKNITIPVEEKVFNDIVEQIKEVPSQGPEVGRYIDNADKVIEDLALKSEGSALVAEIQHELGLRASEAIELANNPEMYLKDGEVAGMVGKGNHEYAPKEITQQLEEKLLTNEAEIPSYRTYANHLPDEINSHDFRFTYAKDTFEKLMEEGGEYKAVLLQVSQDLNHNREEMTNYYLKRC
jgi:hypothetical protein